MFERAIELDPDYALAYAGVADSCSLLVHWYGESSDANVQHADQASRKALELDSESAEAHAARGFALWLMNRYEDSDKEFAIAVSLNPALFDARYYHARACYQRGKFAEAAELFEQACSIREDHEARYFAAQTYTAMGEAEKARHAYERALEAVRKHVELNPDDARAVTMGAVALCRLGEGRRGLEWAERALEIDPEDAGISYNAACLFAIEGETDRAIDCLESSVRGGFANREWVENDPDLDSLRDHPRFKALRWRE
jgi:adenylate cyclase